ncbi:MAG: HipA domain-containing protein [Actinobacteria bacterium]|nr:HipA domain-containing protein [Actinomycetota bacterium]MCL5446974.1 HipA domain-containing protein [Actinomycetota bacterium]
MADRLAVWLYGVKVAVVERERRRLRLEYLPETMETIPFGTPLLSMTLPLTNERFGSGVVRPFLDGLLPEGDSRRVLAEELGLRADESFGLVSALGRDCAGAVVIQPDNEPAPPSPTVLSAESLTDEALGDLVANLRAAPLGVDMRVRISLAGVQEKLLLTKMPDGRWGRPVDGTPSTHILKPEIAAFPHTVENEAFCMRVAKHLGIPVASVETTVVGGRKLIVVERYDRLIHPNGVVTRLHQEDFCQATGIPPGRKYEEDGGPSLRRIAGILQSAAASADAVETLLRMVTLNVVIGNGDAHGKNFSLIHEPSGALRLAPAYDLMSTLFYGDDRLAMYIGDDRRMDRVTTDRLIKEAIAWGLSRSQASDIVGQLLDAIPVAVERADEEMPGGPPEIRQIIANQLERLQQISP